MDDEVLSQQVIIHLEDQKITGARDSGIIPSGWGIGIAGMVVGATIAASGLVTYLVGRNQVRLIGERASASSQIELELGFTPSGIGLALNF